MSYALAQTLVAMSLEVEYGNCLQKARCHSTARCNLTRHKQKHAACKGINAIRRRPEGHSDGKHEAACRLGTQAWSWLVRRLLTNNAFIEDAA